jgi:hypothetical protein
MRCCQTLHDAHGHICWAHRARLSCCADQRARLVVESLLHAALAPVRCCACFGSLFAWQATACWMVAWNLPASESACSQQARAPVLAMHVGTEARAAAEGARTLRRVRKCPRILVSSGGWRTCAWHAHAGVPSRPSRRRASCRSAPHCEGQHVARPAELARLTLPPRGVQAFAPACMYAREVGGQRQPQAEPCDAPSAQTPSARRRWCTGSPPGARSSPGPGPGGERARAHDTQRTARSVATQHPTWSARQYVSRSVRTRARPLCPTREQLVAASVERTSAALQGLEARVSLQGHLSHSLQSTSATGVHGRPLCRLAGRGRCTGGSMERGPSLFPHMVHYRQAEAGLQRTATAGELTAMASSSSSSAALCVSLSCSRPIAASKRSLRRCLAVGSSGPVLGAAGAAGAGLPVPMACSVEARILCICGHNLEIYISGVT